MQSCLTHSTSRIVFTLLAVLGCGNVPGVDNQTSNLLVEDFASTCKVACELEEQGGCGIGDVNRCYESCDSLTQSLVAEAEKACLEHGFLATGCDLADICFEPICGTATWLHTYATCRAQR